MREALGWAGVSALIAEQAGERGYHLEQQRVDAVSPVSFMAGAELGDGLAVLGLSIELADAGRDGRGHVRSVAVWRGAVSPG